ncbi:MAG: choice-of-anchor J domain-containing protein [Anaerolineae bacterium]|nr:choice-of-anchor J domain-containing protein [Anaerolineae bacterium]
MKTRMKLISTTLAMLALLIAFGVALANGPDGNGARGGIPDITTPEVDPLDLTEGFDDITTLPGSGWFNQNNSSPVGTLGWFQGNLTVFTPHAGSGYLAANFNSTAGAGTISNWMVTPVLNLNDGDQVSFWTRTATGSIWPDRLELRMSLNGASTNVGTLATDVGDFTTLLLSVNPTLAQFGYPEVWTQFTATISGVPTPTDGRLAFRYFVTNGGPSGANSNYIGIDTFSFVDATLPSLDISISPASQNVPFGGMANFTVVVTNTGNVDLINVAVVSSEVADCDETIGSLDEGDSYTYTCMDMPVTTSYTNTVTVTGNEPTPQFGGVTASADALVIVEPPTSVSLSSFDGSAPLVSPTMIALAGLAIIVLGFAVYHRLNVVGRGR